MTPQLKIGIAGLGMVGTPLKRYFEEIKEYRRGENLFLFDIDKKKGYSDDINRADAVFLCVPTPMTAGGHADIGAVELALKMLNGEKIVIVKSTVPPGTTEDLQTRFPQHKILFNPEFLTESRAWEDMINPDRQVVGYAAHSKSYASVILNLLPMAYFSSPGALGTYEFLRLNSTEAELGKYAGNLFGALKVTFGNVIKDFCDAISVASGRASAGADYENVRVMLSHDRRIGASWLDAGYHNYRGYGGYCFPKDTSALIARGEEFLKKIPSDSPEYMRLAAGLNFLKSMREYNRTLLKTQGLTEEDVSVHDKEWIQKKMNKEV
ncbi:MAG: UDP-glucose/GDP-mannose dehydrogenase dimerization [Parcubacteria group bacterium GW2011_GWA2_45_30]|nr:MAG: UDP-glucose/GDP-mannose dehydrogenase dimerization [Parcubacteria group bacterium GW2011_GWA2_45_30]